MLSAAATVVFAGGVTNCAAFLLDPAELILDELRLGLTLRVVVGVRLLLFRDGGLPRLLPLCSLLMFYVSVHENFMSALGKEESKPVVIGELLSDASDNIKTPTNKFIPIHSHFSTTIYKYIALIFVDTPCVKFF